MKSVQVMVMILILGLGAAGFGYFHSSNSTQPDVKNLYTGELDTLFTPDREVKIDLVEIPPNEKLETHWHPGEEFHYYLEGDVKIEIEGENPITGKPGTIGHVPFKKMHTATAGREGAKILVFRVHTKGKPWRYLESNSIKQ